MTKVQQRERDIIRVQTEVMKVEIGLSPAAAS